MALLKSILIFLVSAFILLPARASYGQEPEYQVKAAMMYNFALFVEWPPSVFSTPTSPLVFCVFGEDPFGPWLKHELAASEVGGHPISIRSIKNMGETRQCHLIFIGRSEETQVERVIAGLKDASVLTVSDIGHFCDKGGMVGFVEKGNKVRFEMNSGMMEKVGLRANVGLKRIAVKVRLEKVKEAP